MLEEPAQLGLYSMMSDSLSNVSNGDMDIQKIRIENDAFLVSLAMYKAEQAYSGDELIDFVKNLLAHYYDIFEGIHKRIHIYHDEHIVKGKFFECNELFVDNLMLLAGADMKNNLPEYMSTRLGLFTFVVHYVKSTDKFLDGLFNADIDRVKKFVLSFIEHITTKY